MKRKVFYNTNIIFATILWIICLIYEDDQGLITSMVIILLLVIGDKIENKIDKIINKDES